MSIAEPERCVVDGCQGKPTMYCQKCLQWLCQPHARAVPDTSGITQWVFCSDCYRNLGFSADARLQAFKVFINGEQLYLISDGNVTYEYVVRSAYKSVRPANAWSLFTVTYGHGASHREGSLLPGQSVQIADGMIFDAVITGNA